MSEPERPATDLAGTVLEGAYRLVRLKGQGGMGAVYEAVQLRLNKRVAVKLMARELASNPEALARFHREAEITSQLGHPHLVNVIDFGLAESGEPYLVMEYLEGEDLEHRIQQAGCLPVEAAVHITKQVASALAAAHAKDVVHRDLKPANIYLMQVPGEPDFVKVLDFGISKVKAARAKLTRATAVIGTPNYMSPEQAAGRVDETDHRADQWALACIVWEMLVGRTPFVADDVSPLFYQITNLDPPSLAKAAPDLPPEVEPVLRRALSKRPADRFPGMREFSRAFEEAGLGFSADVTPTPMGLSSDQWASRTGTGIRAQPSVVNPVEGRDAQARAAQGDRGLANKATTFSQTTGESTQQTTFARFRRFKLVYAVSVAAGLALVVGGLVFLRAGNFSTRSVPGLTTAAVAAAPVPNRAPAPAPAPVPAPVPALVVPLPESAPTIAPQPEPSPHGRPVKVKASTGKAKSGSVDVSAKHKAMKDRSSRRIFQEL